MNRILIIILSLLSLIALPSPALAAPLKEKTIDLGSCAKRVEDLRSHLYSLSYLPKAGGKCYNEKARQGVIAFQKKVRISVDGVVGKQTIRALNKAEYPKAKGSGSGKRIYVSLGRQLVYLINDKKVIRTISISSGQSGFNTPTGSFSVYRKEEMSWSRPYQVWMPWASYFTGGIAFHSSNDVPNYPASHGCVRVAAPFAKELYRFAAYGVRVDVN